MAYFPCLVIMKFVESKIFDQFSFFMHFFPKKYKISLAQSICFLDEERFAEVSCKKSEMAYSLYLRQIIFSKNWEFNRQLLLTSPWGGQSVGDIPFFFWICVYLCIYLYRLFFSSLPLKFLITPPILNFFSFWKLL